MIIALLGHFRVIHETMTYTEEEVAEGLAVSAYRARCSSLLQRGRSPHDAVRC